PPVSVNEAHREGAAMSVSGIMIWVVGIVCVVIGMYALATSKPRDGEREIWLGRLSKKIFSRLHLL
ncbi:MAG: hypothetical protein LBB66_07535, partial [Desulfovibrio sp.]|nr:hypothetical protein [Desulfovibrio sp.]